MPYSSEAQQPLLILLTGCSPSFRSALRVTSHGAWVQISTATAILLAEDPHGDMEADAERGER